MIKPMLVGAVLIGCVCEFAKADDPATTDFLQPSLQNLEKSLPKLDGDLVSGAVVPTASGLATTGAEISTGTMAAARESSDSPVAPRYEFVTGANAGSSNYSLTLVIEILAVGAIFVGALIVLFRYMARVIYS